MAQSALAERIDAGGAVGPIDLTDAASFRHGHPYAAYDWMRTNAPVYRHPAAGGQPPFWALTRHEDIVAVSRDNVRFTSRKGNRLPDKAGASLLKPEIREALGNVLLTFDPPQHAELRRPLQPGFMPQALRKLEAQVDSFVTDLVAGLAGRDSVEFVTEVAAIVPIKTLCLMLGIPLADEHRVFDWTNQMVGTSDPDFGLSPAESSRVFEEVFAYGEGLIAARAAAPTDDILSAVALLTADGAPISESIRNGFFALLLAAGNETTRNALSGAIVGLSRFPDQRAVLVAQPDLIAKSIAEFLRYISPVTQMMRTALEDVEIGGETIAAGERVVLLYGAGNTDPEVFPDPYRLDLARPNASRHLAFGNGIHHCLGARVAAFELEIMLREMLAAFPNIAIAGPPEYLHSNFVCGIKRLPVSLTGV